MAFGSCDRACPRPKTLSGGRKNPMNAFLANSCIGYFWSRSQDRKASCDLLFQGAEPNTLILWTSSLTFVQGHTHYQQLQSCRHFANHFTNGFFFFFFFLPVTPSYLRCSPSAHVVMKWQSGAGGKPSIPLVGEFLLYVVVVWDSTLRYYLA